MATDKVFADCSKIGTTVVYINGIWETEVQAKQDTTNLATNYRAKGKNNDVTFINGYNPSHVAGLDDLVSSVEQAYGNVGVDYDLTNILLQAHDNLKNQKILLMGHSQGTFYTNSAYDYLIGHGVDKKSIAVYNVATPASLVAGNGLYLTSSTDQVINTIVRDLATVGSANKPLPANIDIKIPDNIQPVSQNGHSFSEVYLGLAPDRVIGDMDSQINNLSSSATDKAECFVAPKTDIIYNIEDGGYNAIDTGITYFSTTPTSPFKDPKTTAAVINNFLTSIYNFGSGIAQAATKIVVDSNLWGGAISEPIAQNVVVQNVQSSTPIVNPPPPVVTLIPIVPQQEDLQDQLDDIQEKLDIISAEVQVLVAHQNAQNNVLPPVVEVKDKNKNEDKENQDQDDNTKIVLAVKKNNGGGGSSNPIIYPQILISEVQENPVAGRFVELYNPNSSPVDLTGWYLQRKDANDTSWGSFVSGSNFNGKIIPANGYFVISRQLPGSNIVSDITLSDNNQLALKNPSEDIVDQVSWSQFASGLSWGRAWDLINNVEQNFELQTPTPGAQNITYVAPTPTPTPDPSSTPTPTPTPAPILPSIVSYKISNPIFTPNGDGLGDTTSVDLEFSEQVKVSLDIVDLNGAEIKNLYSSPAVTNPSAKVWDGTNIAGTVVANGVYTVKIVFSDANGNSVTDTSKKITVANPFNENTAVTSPFYVVGALNNIYANISNVFLNTPKSIFLNNITFEAGAIENTASSSLSDPIKNNDTINVTIPNGTYLIYTVVVDPTTWSEGVINSFTSKGDFILDTSNFMPNKSSSCIFDYDIDQNIFPAKNKNMGGGSGAPCSAKYPTYELNVGAMGYKTAGEYDFYLSYCLGIHCPDGHSGDYYRMNFDGTNWSAISPTLPPADTTPPTGTIIINNGAPYTNDKNVTLTLSATDDSSGVAQMQFNNGTGSYSDWETYSTTKSWTLSSSGDGLKTVRVKFQDVAGNANATGIPATITLDTKPPVITLNGDPTINLNVGDTYSELGATVADENIDSSALVIGGDMVDTSLPGTYHVIYDATDKAGNVAVQVVRTVVVGENN